MCICCCCCCCCGWSDLRRANGFDRATLSQTLFTTLFCSHSRAFATHWSNMRHAWLSCICLRRLWLNAEGNVCVLNVNSDFIKIAMEWNKWQIEHCLLLSTHFRLWGCFLCFVLFKNKQKNDREDSSTSENVFVCLYYALQLLLAEDESGLLHMLW